MINGMVEIFNGTFVEYPIMIVVGDENNRKSWFCLSKINRFIASSSEERINSDGHHGGHCVHLKSTSNIKWTLTQSYNYCEEDHIHRIIRTDYNIVTNPSA